MAGFSLVVVLSLIVGLGRVLDAVDRNDQMAAALDGVFELSTLTTDYIVYQEKRAEDQWLDKHEVIGRQLEGLGKVGHDPEIVRRLLREHAELGDAFAEIVRIDQGELAGTVPSDVAIEYEDRMTARLLVVMQGMVADAINLGERASQEARDAATWTVNVAIVAAGLGILAMAFNALATDRAVVRPLVGLRDSALRVGAGDLRHRTGYRGADEVGELAAAFDSMVADLQRSYSLLEQEILDRRKAEESLSEHKDHLEELVETRTGELAKANEGLMQANERLAHMNEELLGATHAKDDFLAAMSHELRTPLNSIIGFTNMMLRGLAGEINEEQAKQLGMVYRSGKHLLVIVNDLLDLSRIEAGHLDVTFHDIDVRHTVAALVETVLPMADEKELAVSWRCEPDVPVTMTTDGGKLEQILLNLLTNAVKYTFSGSIELVVDVSGSEILFAVQDTGIGISEHDLDRVFERFHQLQVPNVAKSPGVGLGLVISRSLAETLGGTLTVVSEVGRGSVFTLALPLTPPLVRTS